MCSERNQNQNQNQNQNRTQSLPIPLNTSMEPRYQSPPFQRSFGSDSTPTTSRNGHSINYIETEEEFNDFMNSNDVNLSQTVNMGSFRFSDTDNGIDPDDPTIPAEGAYSRNHYQSYLDMDDISSSDSDTPSDSDSDSDSDTNSTDDNDADFDAEFNFNLANYQFREHSSTLPRYQQSGVNEEKEECIDPPGIPELSLGIGNSMFSRNFEYESYVFKNRAKPSNVYTFLHKLSMEGLRLI